MIPASVQPLVDELLARSTFPPAGTHLDCAVSGGADSSALLILGCAAGCVVTSHHVDHRIREGSELEADVVARLAARFAASFVAHVAPVERGPNLEARARSARFGVLPDSVVTGHTLDDRAETVLVNLLRGAARPGLSPLRDRARHPIVGLRRAQTEALCVELGVDVVRDPSNSDPSFVRNRLRHELLPLMNEIAERDVALILDRQADLLGAEDEFLDALASRIDPSDAKAVAAADPVVARRAVRHFLCASLALDHPPSSASVDRVLDVARGNATACEIEGGHRVHRTHQKLRLQEPAGSLDSQ